MKAPGSTDLVYKVFSDLKLGADVVSVYELTPSFVSSIYTQYIAFQPYLRTHCYYSPINCTNVA